MKVLVAFGTRPEAIKMLPLVLELKKVTEIETIVLSTGQHKEMLKPIFNIFGVKPDYDLDIMKENQTLVDVFTNVLNKSDIILKEEKPDLVLVHGDTSTAFAMGLSAFYNQIKVGHIEAGLRTYDKYSPYPEEMNRKLLSSIADYHFAPTDLNKKNLENEGIKENIFVTGNTVIDALKYCIDDEYSFNDKLIDKFLNEKNIKILLTVHRRENLGDNMYSIFSAIKEIVELHQDIEVIYPMHLNPKVREIAYDVLSNVRNVYLVEPIEYKEFCNLMNKVDIIMTDSGGLQEEAPALNKPVLVLRKETERPEGITAGTIKLIGVNKVEIVKEIEKLLFDKSEYYKMKNSINPYGDGFASKKIVDIIKKMLIKI